MLTETTENGEPDYWDTDDRNDYQVQQVLVECEFSARLRSMSVQA